MIYHLIARPTAIDRFFNWLGRNTPVPPEPNNVAALYAELAAFKAAHDQQISALGVQIEHERTERRRLATDNTQLQKDLAEQRGYADMLLGNIKTLTESVNGLATDASSLRTLARAADDRLKWQADTIDAMKSQIKELQGQVVQLTKERADLIHDRQVDQARITWLTQENAMLRGVVPADQLVLIDDRMNTGALRRTE